MTGISTNMAPQKWRPSLGMVIIAILVLVLSLPMVSLFFFRVYENHLVRQAESELIAQSVGLAAVFGADWRHMSRLLPLGPVARNKEKTTRLVFPRLDISNAKVLPPRERGRIIAIRSNDKYEEMSKIYSAIIQTAQNIMPAEILILDAEGIVIAGGSETGLSLAHIEEISAAISGAYASVVRRPVLDKQAQDVIDIAGNTHIYTALPVMRDNRVAGIIYMSKQPKSVFTALYQQRYRLGLAAIIMMSATLFMGWVLTRTIARPVHNLIDMTAHIGSKQEMIDNISRSHGTRELAQLSDSFLAMSQKLIERSDYIFTFAAHVSHELKSPLTATRGAVELLLDDGSKMNAGQRRKFLGNILEDTQRLTRLVERLHTLAQAENPSKIGKCSLKEITDFIRAKFPNMEIDVITGNPDADIGFAMSFENAEIVFSNLIENAVLHAANVVEITASKSDEKTRILIKDNGTGISPGNAGRIFELFFTSRREEGGTGMGLVLVRAILDAHKGGIELLESDKDTGGAAFEITIPAI